MSTPSSNNTASAETCHVVLDDASVLPVFDEIVDDMTSGAAMQHQYYSPQQHHVLQHAQQHAQHAVLQNAPATVGKHTGQVKWWNDKLGFGFATICDEGPDRGRDVFVHHTGIRPMNSCYRTLRKGEYVSFNITQGLNGQQAIDVTGVCGGMLMCDAQQFQQSHAQPL